MTASMLRLAVIAFILSAPVAVSAQSPKSDADPVVAKVNGETIRRSEVLETQKLLPPQYRNLPLEQIYPLLLDEMIDSRLATSEARRMKLQNDPQVKRRIANAEDQILREAYFDREVTKVLTDQELRKRYDEIVAAMPKQEEIRARHIVVKTKEEAEAIIKQLQAGGDFAAIAKEKSADGSKDEGGDLGYFTKGDVVPAFWAAADALKPGEITKTPVETEFGWHVIQVEDRRTAQPPPFDSVREQLYNQLSRQVIADQLEKLRGKAKVERFNLDGTPRKE
ncbi:MAG: peptidylprolyl isomerase [Alphaproteobacteria bacterium]